MKLHVSKNDGLWTAAILITALLLMLPVINSGIWGDEIITYDEAVLGVPVAITGKPATFLDIQLVLANLGYHIAGNEPWGIRLPSLLFALGTILFTGKVANDLFGREVKYIAMLMTTFSPILIEFGVEGRPYTALAFWGIAFIYALNKFLEKETPRHSISLAVIAICGLLTRLTFLGQLAVGGLIYLFHKRGFTRYSLGILLITAPFMAKALIETMMYDGISTKLNDAEGAVNPLNFAIRAIFSFTYGYNTFLIPEIPKTRNVPISQLVEQNLWIFVAIGVIALGMLIGFLFVAKKFPRKTGLLLLFVLVPSVVMVLIAQTGYTIIREKFLIAALGAYLILLAAIFKELLRFKIGYLVVGLYGLVIALGFYNFYIHPDTHTRRMLTPELNEFLLSTAEKGDMLASYETLTRKPVYYTILKTGIATTTIYDEADNPDQYKALVNRMLNQSAGHHIFFVDDTKSRQMKDADGLVIEQLKSQRKWTRKPYGRNFALYIFESTGRAR